MEETLHESKCQDRKRLVGLATKTDENPVNDRDGTGRGSISAQPYSIPALAGDLLRPSATLEWFSGVNMLIFWPVTSRLSVLKPGTSVL